MAEKIIIDIEMSSEDVRRAERDIMNARKRVEELKEANKNLEKTSEAYTKNAIELKKLNANIRTNERVLIANEKAREANSQSVEQLRERLKVVSVQWAREAKAMGDNSDKAKKLAAEKSKLTNQLKALEKQTGDTRRNVGNYSEGMREALTSSNAFSSGFANLNGIMKANPIMLVVLALLKFGEAVGKAQFIVDAFNKVVEPLNTMFSRMIGLVQELIDGGLAKLGEILRDPIGALTSLGEEMGKAAEEGRKLARLTIEIEEAQNALILTEGKLRREIEAQRFAVEDLSRSEEERKEAAKLAIQAVKDLEAARLEVLNKQIQQAEIRAAQNDTDRKAQGELNKLLAQRDQIAADSFARQKEIRNQQNTINKQQQDQARRQYAEDQKNFEATEKEKTRILEEQAQRRHEIIAEDIQRNNDIYLLGLKQQLLDEEITRAEFDQKMIDRELLLLQAQRAARILNGQETVDLDNKIADLQIKNRERVARADKQAGAAQVQVQDATLDNAFDVGKQGVNLAKQFAGENVGVAKAAALAQAGINIAQSITKALADSGPILGPILGAISAALGAVQQARIRSAPQNFAEGVIGLEGPGTATSDSIPANLSRGESVITAKASKVYAPVLAAMEQSVGNVPNYQLGNRRFANGVLNAGNLPGITSGRAAISEGANLAAAIESLKVFVSLTELNERQEEFAAARSFANITE